MQKKYRLTHKRAFSYVYRKGKSLTCDSLVLAYAPTKYGKRIGFSISHKVGKAVVRNKIKRRLKNGLIPVMNHIDNGYNYIFIAREKAAEITYSELINSAIYLLKKAKLYN